MKYLNRTSTSEEKSKFSRKQQSPEGIKGEAWLGAAIWWVQKLFRWSHETSVTEGVRKSKDLGVGRLQSFGQKKSGSRSGGCM